MGNSRAIKFRAWDKSNCMMVTDPFAWMNVKEEIIDNDNGQLIQNDPKVRYELMQYTGLKDKNGKEIYEGDILGFNGKMCLVSFWDGCFVVVYPPENRKEIEGEPVTDDLGSFLKCLRVGIVGNIHENTELLEE